MRKDLKNNTLRLKLIALIYDHTAIVFISDHGEYTGDFGAAQKGMFFYDLNVHVPLIVHAPFLGGQGGVVDSFVQNLDLFATMLDLGGVPLPAGSYSRSLLPLVADPAASMRDAAFAETFTRKMVRQDNWKLIVDHTPDGLELYDLAADPGERTNRAADPELQPVVIRLLRRLVQWTAETETETGAAGSVTAR